MASNSISGHQSAQNYAELISNYESVNDMLREELDELKNRSHSEQKNRSQASRSESINSPEHRRKVEELSIVKAQLEENKRTFIADHLKAALWHKATSMYEMEPTTRMCKQGMLNLQRTVLDRGKKTWVGIHCFEGNTFKNEFKPGYVMLEYADTRDSETLNRCKVTEVFVADSNAKGATFSARVMYEGSEEVLVFESETLLERDDWVKSIMTALAEVRDIYNWHKDNYYTLKLEFAKEKIGLLIKERLIEVDEKSETGREKAEVKSEKQPPLVWQKDTVGTGNEMKVKEEEGSCELCVLKIVDKDLLASGLRTGSILLSINDTVLVGKVCSEQIKLLCETPKPFTLTFRGRNFETTAANFRNRSDGYISMLKKLVAFRDNDIKNSFIAMIKGTLLERELKSSHNKSSVMISLLDNQRRLIDLLQNITYSPKKQSEEQEFKE